jgi:hypothetical protein
LFFLWPLSCFVCRICGGACAGELDLGFSCLGKWSAVIDGYSIRGVMWVIIKYKRRGRSMIIADALSEVRRPLLALEWLTQSQHNG